MDTLRCLIAGPRPALPTSANRIAIPLLLILATLAFVQACAALTYDFQATG
jgi:hypothetical protein